MNLPDIGFRWVELHLDVVLEVLQVVGSKNFFCKYKVYTRGHIPKHKKTLKLRVQGLKFKTTPDLLTPVPRTLEYFCGIVFLQYYIHLSKTQYIQPRTNIFYNNRLHVLKNTLNSRVLSCSGICPLM